VAGDLRRLHDEELHNLAPHQILLGWSYQEGWDGLACSTHGREYKCTQYFRWKIWRKEATWKT